MEYTRTGRWAGSGANNHLRYNMGHKDSVWGTMFTTILDFGFDLIPTPAGVSSISGIGDLQLYPNPSDGRFTVSFEMQKAVKEVKLTVTNMVGQQIVQEYYQNADKRFTKEVDISNMSKGVYFVEIVADEERVVKKVVVR